MTYNIPDTRASLLIRLRQPGNQEAWREFASLYEPLVYRLALRRGFQHADAQDLIQEVMVAISRGIDRLEINEGAGRFRGWLFRISRNLIINALEKQSRQVLGSGDSDVFERLTQEPAISIEERTLYALEFRRELFRWAARTIQSEFHPTTWTLFWRTSVQGAAIADTARELGLSLGAAYAARCRVLVRLRRQVEEVEDPSQ